MTPESKKSAIASAERRVVRASDDLKRAEKALEQLKADEPAKAKE